MRSLFLFYEAETGCFLAHNWFIRGDVSATKEVLQ